ncbi:MAG TPA: capsular biosynthesis protein [Bacteroidia bacterium]|nr:capsular biosynthesis protein [Bacteroidia bacterium]HRH09316.1 capsular biosynthesis protein [Bacteroidia bacterium]HRH62872.1 capsular biosynthesis protein [Bacteroidia bacterium]
MGFFDRFFTKSTRLDKKADLSLIGVDMHSHFIPGIDDGAQTIEDSVNLLKAMSEFGYRKVITTPHIMSDFYQNNPEIILSGLAKVKEAIQQEGIAIEVEAAAEYYLDFDLEAKIDKGGLLTFGNNYLLFEVSYMNPPDILNQVIFKLATNGYRPVLAHPERYPFWYNDFEKYEEFKDKGVLLQLNINSLTGYYGGGAKKIAEQMIEKNMVDFIGSDCHRMDHIQVMKDAQCEKYLHQLIESGMLRNAAL